MKYSPGVLPSCRPLAAALVLAGGLSGCTQATPSQQSIAPNGTTGSSSAPAEAGSSTSASAELEATNPPATAPSDLLPVALALSFIPKDATTATVTDWDAIRERLGVPDLTSTDLMTDRIAFWQHVEQSTLLLTEGLLLDDNSLLEIDYGFTQDDVDWEARWRTPDGAGYVLALRPDLPLDGVRRALVDDAGPLAGATLIREYHLIVKDEAEATESWATDPALGHLASEHAAESSYLRRGCISLEEAIGPDATAEDQRAITKRHDLDALGKVDAIAVQYAGTDGQVWLGGDPDLAARAALTTGWPAGGTLSWTDGFTGEPEVDRHHLDLSIRNDAAAANLTLGGQLPFAICTEVTPIPEPTGS